jgi:spermidine synthase
VNLRRLAIPVASLAALAAVTVWKAIGGADDEGTVTVYDRESRYYRIRVLDYPHEGRRCLHFSKSRGVQSSMLMDDPVRLDLRYSQTMVAALPFVGQPKDVLLVGLGGASLPKFVQKHWPDVHLDIVELDPDVVKVCQKFFKFEGTPNTRVFVTDGRLYLKRTEKKYDVILLDAYAADHIPFHLTTLEFVRLVKERLKPGGLVASNLWEHAVNRFYYAELRTFQETFPQTYIFAAGSSGNIIVFGAMSEERVSAHQWIQRAKALAGERDLGLDLPALIGREYRVLTDQPISEAALTDDMAPVNILRHESPRHYEQEAAKQP